MNTETTLNVIRQNNQLVIIFDNSQHILNYNHLFNWEDTMI